MHVQQTIFAAVTVVISKHGNFSGSGVKEMEGSSAQLSPFRTPTHMHRGPNLAPLVHTVMPLLEEGGRGTGDGWTWKPHCKGTSLLAASKTAWAPSLHIVMEQTGGFIKNCLGCSSLHNCTIMQKGLGALCDAASPQTSWVPSAWLHDYGSSGIPRHMLTVHHG